MTLLSSTKLIGLIGNSVSHSLSPRMQNAALSAWKKDVAYGAFLLQEGGLKTAIEGAAAMGFLGLNITMPYKERAMEFCQPDEKARNIGALNTLRFEDGKAFGTNTDIDGFLALCKEAGIQLTPKTRAVVLGAGGAARAVIAALQNANAQYQVFSRTPKVLRFEKGDVSVVTLCKEAGNSVLSDCDVLIDCTNRGWISSASSEAEEKTLFSTHYPELDLSFLPKHVRILDLAVTNRSLLTTLGQNIGLRCHLGHAMLVGQGVKALSYWFSEPVPMQIEALMRACIFPQGNDSSP